MTEHGPRRGRGRPPGLFGSSFLRKSLRESLAAEDVDSNSNANSGSVVGRVGRPRADASSHLSTHDDAESLFSDNQMSPVSIVLSSGNPLQNLVGLHARAQSQRNAVEDSENPALHILTQGRRNIMSEQAAANNFTNADVRRVASTLVEASSYLWGKLFDHIQGLFHSGWSGMMLQISRRYDETPLFLRVEEDDSQPQGQAIDSQTLPGALPKLKGNSKGKKCCKIMQSELHVAALLKHDQSQQTVLVKGKFPSWLQCLESTKAPQIAKSQLEMLSALPNLQDFGRNFMLKHLLTCTDRYGANIVAERHVQSKHPGWVKTLNSCQVHEIAACEKAMGSIVGGHMGGIVSVGLCMRHAGALRELRKCLMQLLDEELQVVIGFPTPEMEKHRQAIYDLFLPIHDAVSTEVSSKPTKKKDKMEPNHRRRTILAHFLNGDITSDKVIHLSPVERDRADVLAEAKMLLPQVLLPVACPVLNRNKWLGAEASFNYVGLLLAHHGLLSRLMIRWKGMPKVSTADPQNLDKGLLLGPGLDDWASSWAEVAAGYSGASSTEPNAQPPPDDDFGDEVADDQYIAELQFNPVTGDVDWDQQNKANAEKAVAWAITQPTDIIIMICIAWQPVLRLMKDAIYLGSEQFNRDQCVKQECRSYRVLELYLGNHINTFWRSINTLFHTVPAALPASGRTCYMRSLCFRLLSSCARAVEQIVAAKHRGAPYVLFGSLWGIISDLKNLPECLYCELTSFFVEAFGIDGLCEPVPQSMLASIAEAMQHDIVGIEVRHASVRRTSVARSCNTHAMSVEDVSADFTVRQQVILREKAAKHRQEELDAASGKQSLKKKRKSMTRPKRTKVVSRGGAFRAYCHYNYQGQKLTATSMKQAGAAYRAIKAAGGSDYQFYKDLGVLGTLAGRRGHKAYKPFKPPEDSRAIVAGSSASLQALQDKLAKIKEQYKRAQEYANATTSEDLKKELELSEAGHLQLSNTCDGFNTQHLLDMKAISSSPSAGSPAFVATPGSDNVPLGLTFFVPADVLAIVPWLPWFMLTSHCEVLCVIGGSVGPGL